MKKIVASVLLRAVISISLAWIFVICLPLKLVVARTAMQPAIDLRTESQYTSEASRYNGAVRSIGGIATMRLETVDDLRSAITIVERARPNLKLLLSKLVSTSVSDATFAGAVKKRLANKEATEAFFKELSADPNAIYKLEGAESLKLRLKRSCATDSAILRNAGEKLKEASTRIKERASLELTTPETYATRDLKTVRVSFRAEAQPNETDPLPAVFIIPLIVMSLVISAYVIGYTVAGADLVLRLFNNLFTEKGQDEVAACQQTADERYQRCEAPARDLPDIFRIPIVAACYSAWLLAVAACLVLA